MMSGQSLKGLRTLWRKGSWISSACSAIVGMGVILDVPTLKEPIAEVFIHVDHAQRGFIRTLGPYGHEGEYCPVDGLMTTTLE